MRCKECQVHAVATQLEIYTSTFPDFPASDAAAAMHVHSGRIDILRTELQLAHNKKDGCANCRYIREQNK